MMGGPMMGIDVCSTDAVIEKRNNAIVMEERTAPDTTLHRKTATAARAHVLCGFTPQMLKRRWTASFMTDLMILMLITVWNAAAARLYVPRTDRLRKA